MVIFSIKGIVIDGKRGLFKAFPVQITGKEYFTHRKLVTAYRSLQTNLPYLFTSKNYPELQMPNTTNSLDGGVFSQLKKLTKIHQGITKSLKSKLIDDYLVSYNKKL